MSPKESQNQINQKVLRPLTAKEKKVLEFIERYLGNHGIAPSYQEIKEFFGFASFNSVQRYLKQLQKKQYIHIPPGNQKRAISVLRTSDTIQNFMNREVPTSLSINLTNQQQPTNPNPFLPNQKLQGRQGPEEASPSSPPVAESLSIPLLGRVAAGSPIEALEHDEFIQAPENLIRKPSKTFALRVEGQSMIEDGILDGDLIFVQEQNTARNGETVVATVDGEATVKHFYFHNEGSRPSGHLKPVGNDKKSKIELRPANSSMESFWYDPEDVQIRGVVVGLIRSM